MPIFLKNYKFSKVVGEKIPCRKINFFHSMRYGRKITVRNPYDYNSLEWTTPIEPGHGNWPGEIPTVYRWPYDYEKDGYAFIPQHVPDSALAEKQETVKS